ncbi:hypothetical protein F4678DRAFT_314176 [Xylaria arbuscula]|nr:hypothetical protein F4678DRAFT_314176 [Xylaria arbuscula]
MAKTALNGEDVELPGLSLDRVLHTSHDLESIMLTTRSILRGPLIPGRCVWPLQVVSCHRRSLEIVPSHRGVRLPTAISNRGPSPFPTRYLAYASTPAICNHPRLLLPSYKELRLGDVSPVLSPRPMKSFLLFTYLSRDIFSAQTPAAYIRTALSGLAMLVHVARPAKCFEPHILGVPPSEDPTQYLPCWRDRVVAAPGSLYLYEMAP